MSKIMRKDADSVDDSLLTSESAVSPTGTRKRRPGGSGGSWFGGSTRGASALRLSISLMVFFGAWELVARFLIHNRLIIVPFSEVVVATWREFQSGQLWVNCWETIKELLVSFPVAVIAGMIVGMILASNRAVRQTFEPIITGINSVPLVALAPLLIAAFGFGMTSKVIVIGMIAIFPVIANTDSGFRSVDPSLLETAKAFRATQLQIVRTVRFPHALPHVVAGIRVAFAKALVGAIVAEFFGSVSGMGFAILDASQSFATARLLSYVALLGLLGLAASIALDYMERRFAPWRN